MTLHATHDRLWHLGYWTAPWARGRRITTRAERAVSVWAFDAYPRARAHQPLPACAEERVAAHRGRGGLPARRDPAKVGLHGPEPNDVVMFSLVRDDLAR